MNNLQIAQRIGVCVERGRGLMDGFNPAGFFDILHLDPFGGLKGEYHIKNGIKTVGKNSVLDVAFHAATQITTWYIGLIDNTGYTAEAAGDTLASHSGWSEFTSYTGTRQEWTEGAASSGSITNSTPVTFAITDTGTVKGIFICSATSGTSGTLWSSGAFVAPVAVQNGDQLKITYTISC